MHSIEVADSTLSLIVASDGVIDRCLARVHIMSSSTESTMRGSANVSVGEWQKQPVQKALHLTK